MKAYLTKPWLICFENGGEGGEGGEGGGSNPPPTPPPVPPGQGDDDKPTLSQKQVNKILAEEKRKHQVVIQKQVSELEQLRQSRGLSEKEKTDLTAKIEELQNGLLTKEQLAEKEKKKLSEEYKKQVEGLSSDRDNWRGLFQKSTIERSITDAAVAAEAFSPTQIVALLGNSTRLVEVTDNEGNAIPGKFIAKVRFDDTDKEGKPVTLDLTIPEAITRMKDRVNEFGNLFKSNLNGGLGKGGGSGKSQDIDPGKMTAEQYREWRNKRLGRKTQG